VFQLLQTDLILVDLFLAHESEQLPHVLQLKVCEFFLEFGKEFVEYLLILLELELNFLAEELLSV
jgi:hypothetical protein